MNQRERARAITELERLLLAAAHVKDPAIEPTIRLLEVSTCRIEEISFYRRDALDDNGELGGMTEDRAFVRTEAGHGDLIVACEDFLAGDDHLEPTARIRAYFGPEESLEASFARTRAELRHRLTEMRMTVGINVTAVQIIEVAVLALDNAATMLRTNASRVPKIRCHHCRRLLVPRQTDNNNTQFFTHEPDEDDHANGVTSENIDQRHAPKPYQELAG